MKILRFLLTAGLSIAMAPLALSAHPRSFSAESEHYHVTTDVSAELANQAAALLDSAIELFNELYHFDTDQLTEKLRVRVFAQKGDYDAYLRTVIEETRDDYVYIDYNNPARSELVGYLREDDFARSLLHLGSIQFLKAFVPRAPLWMREGVAAYLENAKLDLASNTFSWQPNLAWLDTYKSIVEGRHAASAIPLAKLLTLDSEDVVRQNDAFHPQAWALVHFLQQSPDKRVNRIFWDAITALNTEADLRQNSGAVVNRAFAWTDIQNLERQSIAFAQGLRTFNDLVEQGIAAYGSHDIEAAEADFEEALALEPSSYIPSYYLGLINYANRHYAEAEQYYRTALEISDEPALVRYALGVNAFADDRFAQASSDLELAKSLNSVAYGEKVDALLERIEILQ